jgi:hypothetical protein
MMISKKATLSLYTNGLTPRERIPSTYWVGEKVNPTVDLDALENTTNFSLLPSMSDVKLAAQHVATF